MSKQREALEIALEVLDSKHNFNSAEWRVLHYRAFQVIREALAEPEKANQCGETCERAKLCAVCAKGLAEPEQEPVAWLSQGGDVSRSKKHFDEMGFVDSIPLYTSPAGFTPLTDEEIDNLELPPNGCTMRELVRAVERAHGITE